MLWVGSHVSAVAERLTSWPLAQLHASKNQYQFSVPTYNDNGDIVAKGKSAVVIFGAEVVTGDVFLLHGVALEQVKSYKYLGVMLHQALGRLRNPSDSSQPKPWVRETKMEPEVDDHGIEEPTRTGSTRR